MKSITRCPYLSLPLQLGVGSHPLLPIQGLHTSHYLLSLTNHNFPLFIRTCKHAEVSPNFKNKKENSLAQPLKALASFLFPSLQQDNVSPLPLPLFSVHANLVLILITPLTALVKVLADIPVLNLAVIPSPRLTCHLFLSAFSLAIHLGMPRAWFSDLYSSLYIYPLLKRY